MNFRFGVGVTGIFNSIYEEEPSLDKFFYSPNLVASFGYRWMKYDIQFNLDYKFTGKLPQVIRVVVDEEEQLLEGYISAYNMMDFNVGKTFFKDRLGISLGVKNLFNVTTIPSTSGSTGQPHASSSGSTPVGWGRTFFIRATYNLRKN